MLKNLGWTGLAATLILAIVAIIAIATAPQRDVAPKIGAIDQAVIKQKKVIGTEEAKKHGISCVASYPDACVILARKAEANENIKGALAYAAKKGVAVRAVKWFSVENLQVDVNVYASEEEIFKFLTGKSPL